MRISKDSRFTFCFHWADLLGEGKKVDRRKTAEVECGGQGVDGRWTSVKEARSSGDQREKPRAALPAPREPRKVCMRRGQTVMSGSLLKEGPKGCASAVLTAAVRTQHDRW